jgi:triacylglycerol lipase
VVAVLLAALAAGCTPAPGASPSGAVAAAPEVARPVVIVPGWELLCHTRRTDWDRWTAAFVARGLPPDHVVVAFYDTCQPNLTTAAMVGRTVVDLLERTGADKVNLIAHSMGALPTRWCVSFGECAGRVDQVVTLAGANHGTAWAEACFLQFWASSCADMRPGSEMVQRLSLDETPRPVGWETWVSPCELVIVPRESAFLDGAVNHDLVDDCVDHSGWKKHRRTIDAVTTRLAGPLLAAPG